MRLFDVMVGDWFREGLSEDQMEELYRSGQIQRTSRCRETGHGDWQTVDELLPLLKYAHQSITLKEGPSEIRVPERSRLQLAPEVDDRHKPVMTSALKAGWVCFGLGVAAAWIFPPAYLFYSLALLMAIVAMCTHQVNRGLILLLTSFVGMGTSALLSFFLVVGMFAAAVKPGVPANGCKLGRSNAMLI